MTTKQVADQLVKMCREGKVEEAKQELFTEETLSIEPGEGVLPKETKGLKAIQQKADLFISTFYYSSILVTQGTSLTLDLRNSCNLLG